MEIECIGISGKAKIGENTTLGYYNVVEEGAIIGKNCKIGSFNVIKSGAIIGDDVVIENHCTIYACNIGFGNHIRSYVEIRKDTDIGNNCYIDSFVKSSGKNKIGNEVTLRYDSIIARGCVIGDSAYICPQVMTNNVDHNGNQIGGAKVGDRCFIGTQTVLGAGIKIDDENIVGSCSFANKNILGKGVYIGVPVKKIRDIKS